MNTNKQQVEAIFGAAIKLSSTEQREIYLAKACADDPGLRNEVAELIQAYDEAGAFLTSAAESPEVDPVSGGPDGTIVLPPAENAPDRIGRYKLLQQIGEGGCGVVYVAEQEEPVRRRVALKVIKLGMDTRSVIARFEAERQALALMDHPNIAKVLDAGATETGRPYFVMELVRGIKILEYCDQNSLSTQERLDLFIQVCRAVQHAHQKGIIHRDIKPSNILVTLHDGVPVPKVIDFGIAKATTQQRLTDKTLYTAYEQFIGTPAYMSPEQAEMSGLDIDTRSDIYSLGVLLYELLTGRTPFDAKELLEAGLDEMRRMIREREPLRPSTRLATMLEAELTTTAKRRHAEPPRLMHLLKGDLDWIVMKALEKDRRRRYDSAASLVQDLERHLHHEPVMARPPSAAYRAQKFIRRNKLLAGASAAVAAALILGLVTSTWLALKERAQRERAEQKEAEARRAQLAEAKQRRAAQAAQRQAVVAQQRAEANELNLRRHAYLSDMSLAFTALREHRFEDVLRLLNVHVPGLNQEDLRRWEWGHLWHECQSDEHGQLDGHRNRVSSLAFSPDSRLLASASADQTVRIWDVEQQQEVRALPHPGPVSAVAFSASGHEMVTATAVPEGAFVIQHWRTDAWTTAHAVTNAASVTGATLLAMSQGGEFLALALWGGTSVFLETGDGNRLETVTAPGFRFTKPTFAHAAQIVAALDSESILVRNLRSGETLASVSLDLSPAEFTYGSDHGVALALAPDAQSLAYSAHAYELTPHAKDVPLTNTTERVVMLAYSPDGSRLAAFDETRTISVYETQNWSLLATLKDHSVRPTAIAFSPDNRRLASAGLDHVVRMWDLTRPPEGRPRIAFPPGPWDQGVAFASDGTLLVRYEDNRVLITFTDPSKPRIERRLPTDPLDGLHVSPEGRFLCFEEAPGQHVIYSVESMKRMSSVVAEAMDIPSHNGFSPDATKLLGVDRTTGDRIVWRVEDGQEVARYKLPPPESLLNMSHWWGSRSKVVVVAHDKHNLQLWDIEGQRIQSVLRHTNSVDCARMSHDGRLVATLDALGAVRLWDVSGERQLHTLGEWGPLPHSSSFFPFTFTPDSLRIAVVDSAGQVRLFDTSSGREIGRPILHAPTTAVGFTADGQWLVVASLERGLEFLEASAFKDHRE